jgi:branched-subunit amino acid aminotransferase/4-amino-4-deoxychorismate lyase
LTNGVLLEAATANIGFIFGKEFAAPRFETVIKGTTIIKTLKFVEELVKNGTLEKISFRDITIEEGEKADEMIMFGGDKVVPVLSFNDKVISEEPGPITRQIQKWYASAFDDGTPIKIAPELL